MTTENTGNTGGASDLDLFESEATGQPNSTETTTTTPSKYEGKTVDDLIKMHQNAEKLVSRQGSELGQMRRMADEILQLKKPTTQTTEERRTPVTVDALLNDPEKAISAALENSPLARRAQAAEERAARLEARLTETEFASKHTNVDKDVSDPAFLEWVNKNSLRQALAANAAKEGDPNRFVAAKNLWDLWDEHKELVGSASQTTTQTGGTKVRSIPSGTVKSAPAEAKGKPIWSRTKLMELRFKVADGDPAALERWNDKGFQDRMHEAYTDKRVQ